MLMTHGIYMPSSSNKFSFCMKRINQLTAFVARSANFEGQTVIMNVFVKYRITALSRYGCTHLFKMFLIHMETKIEHNEMIMSNDCTNIAKILYLASNFLELILKTYIQTFSHLLRLFRVSSVPIGMTCIS